MLYATVGLVTGVPLAPPHPAPPATTPTPAHLRTPATLRLQIHKCKDERDVKEALVVATTSDGQLVVRTSGPILRKYAGRLLVPLLTMLFETVSAADGAGGGYGRVSEC